MADLVLQPLKVAFSAFKSYKGKLSEIEGIAEDAEELGVRIDMLEYAINDLMTPEVLKRLDEDSKNPLDLTIKKMKEINKYVEKVQAFAEKHKGKSNFKLVFAAVGGNTVAQLPEEMQGCAKAVFG